MKTYEIVHLFVPTQKQLNSVANLIESDVGMYTHMHKDTCIYV